MTEASHSSSPLPGVGLKPARAASRGAVHLCLLMIRCYQAMIRPWLIGSCKFYPTCSEYAAEALHTHGLWRGGRLAARRLFRCHPFGPGGIDPVPPTPEKLAPTHAASE